MSDTLSAHPRGKGERHLSAVADVIETVQAAGDSTSEVFRLAVDYATQRPAPAVLNRAGALRLDQAELFLLSLDTEMLTAETPRAAYLLGIAELHLAGLIELLRAVTA